MKGYTHTELRILQGKAPKEGWQVKDANHPMGVRLLRALRIKIAGNGLIFCPFLESLQQSLPRLSCTE